MSRSYCPWTHLASLPHITFGVTRLPHGSGWWLPEDNAIVLDDRLTRVERRVVLGHELVHAERGDNNCALLSPDGGRLARRQETNADHVSGSRLATVAEIADALILYPIDPELVARELDITVNLLRLRLHSLSEQEKTYIHDQLQRVQLAA